MVDIGTLFCEVVLLCTMKDFSNFDRQESHFRPFDTHLDVFARFKEVEARPTIQEGWIYRLKTFCSVPIILFQCPYKGCNILMHLNIHLLDRLNATAWLHSRRLTFMIFLSDASKANQVVCAKTIRFSELDSDKIRSACHRQRRLSYHQIEGIIDLVYQSEIDQIWSATD